MKQCANKDYIIIINKRETTVVNENLNIVLRSINSNEQFLI